MPYDFAAKNVGAPVVAFTLATTVGEFISLKNLPPEELIVVLNGSGTARRVSASYETQEVPSEEIGQNLLFNIDNFDLPKLKDRMDVQSRKSDWRKRASLFGWGRVEQSEAEHKRTRTGLIPRRQSNRAWNVAGRSIVDAWWQVRMSLRPQRETLSYVSNLLFPEDKDKLSISLINLNTFS